MTIFTFYCIQDTINLLFCVRFVKFILVFLVALIRLAHTANYVKYTHFGDLDIDGRIITEMF